MIVIGFNPPLALANPQRATRGSSANRATVAARAARSATRPRSSLPAAATPDTIAECDALEPPIVSTIPQSTCPSQSSIKLESDPAV
jgi:hypothetical protein